MGPNSFIISTGRRPSPQREILDPSLICLLKKITSYALIHGPPYCDSDLQSANRGVDILFHSDSAECNFVSIECHATSPRNCLNGKIVWLGSAMIWEVCHVYGQCIIWPATTHVLSLTCQPWKILMDIWLCIESGHFGITQCRTHFYTHVHILSQKWPHSEGSGLRSDFDFSARLIGMIFL